ncbi:hypothetical protein F5Y03DRAFT_407032 [Xylaria venustula]|nr:hypothetical protein F5Y03DRAFT_407032 [Xylaria venustula]
MDSFYPSPDAPFSPWATRFIDKRLIYTRENENHSILAPEFPRIDDPKYYDQILTLPEDERPQSAADEDRLFCTEFLQADELNGAPTWKTIALTRHALFSPGTVVSGGHRPIDKKTEGLVFTMPSFTLSAPFLGLQKGLNRRTNSDRDWAIYLRDRIKVDEKKWLSFLRKENWFDWISIPVDFNHSKAGKTWSIDDPKLWERLSVSIELTNRIMETLIRDKHDGVYWSEFEDVYGPPPSPDDAILLSFSAEQHISAVRGTPCQTDHFDKSCEDWRVRLLNLLWRIIWSFREADDTEGSCHKTVLEDDNPAYDSYNAMIDLSIGRLETLMDPDLTLGELCFAQVDIAMTMVHELMHAINCCRYKDDNYAGNCLNQQRGGGAMEEPFLDAKGIAELGHCMDQLFFGGSLFIMPISSENPLIPVVMIIQEFPWSCYKGRTVPGSPFLSPDARDTAHFIPLTWVSKLLSESFWNDPVYPKKLRDLAHRYPGDTEVYKYYYEKRRLWGNLRQGWYDEAKKDWRASPWCWVKKRTLCEDFAIAFKKKDLIQCNNIANALTNTVRRKQDLATYLDDLPSTTVRKPQWAWHAIGLLMMASIPIVRVTLRRELEPTGVYYKELSPSKEAAEFGHKKSVFIPIPYPERPSSYTYPSEFYNPMIQEEEQLEYDQFDCLGLVDVIIQYITAKSAIVHGDMVHAIQRAKDLIMADRTAIQDVYLTADTSKWSSNWFFEPPPYNPTCHKWSGQGWQSLPRDSVHRRSSNYLLDLALTSPTKTRRSDRESLPALRAGWLLLTRSNGQPPAFASQPTHAPCDSSYKYGFFAFGISSAIQPSISN